MMASLPHPSVLHPCANVQVARYFAFIINGGLHDTTFNIGTLITALLEDKMTHRGIIVSSRMLVLQIAPRHFVLTVEFYQHGS